MLSNRTQWPADPIFGGLFAALSPASMAEVLRAHLRRDRLGGVGEWRGCRAIEALYDAGEQVRVAYALTRDAGAGRRVWPDGRLFYIRYPVREPMSARGRVVRLGGFDVEIYRLPNDRRLRALRKFSRRDRAAQAWQRWLSADEPGMVLEPETLRRSLLRYVPEQKWIIRLQGGCRAGGKGELLKHAVVVRSSGLRDCRNLYARTTALRRAGRQLEGAFRMPKPVGHDDPSGLLAVRWVWGKSLLEMLRDHAVDQVMQGVAAGLHAFHQTPLDGLPSRTAADHLAAASRCAEDLAAVLPELRAPVVLLMAELSRQRPQDEHTERRTVHNDFHWNQVRGRPDRLTVLDFERCIAGDPMIDVATFVSQMETLPLRQDVSVTPAEARGYVETFLASWEARTRQGVDFRRLRWYSALALLTLARGLLRHLRPGWPQVAQRCVELAGARLDSAELELTVR